MEILRYVVEIIIIPFVIGAIASVIATLLLNRKINPEELIKRDILMLIDMSLNACMDKHLIKFRKKDFVKSVPIWQEYKNELVKIISKVKEDESVNPRLFGIDKAFESFNADERNAYEQFCNNFKRNFTIKFNMDGIYPVGVVSTREKENVRELVEKASSSHNSREEDHEQ